jgi:hypothetical protein
MKKGTVGKLVIGFVLLVIGFGCRKDGGEAGPASVTGPTSPGEAGPVKEATAEWIIKTWTSNGADLLNYNYDSNITCSGGGTVYHTDVYTTTSLIWNIKENGDIASEDISVNKSLNYDLSYSLCDDYYTTTNDTILDKGTWKSTSIKNQIEIKFLSKPNTMTFDIKELSEKEMKLEGVVDGVIQQITLSKK